MMSINTNTVRQLSNRVDSTPVVGAQYRWTGLYAPRAMTPAFWSLMQGIMSTVIKRA